MEVIAARPPVNLRPVSPDDVRAHVGPLVSTLKSKAGSDAQGKLQRAVYAKALEGIPVWKLARACVHFAAHAEWMPTPAEIRRQCLAYAHPAERAQARAKRLVRERQHRLRDEMVHRVRERELDPALLAELDPWVADYLVRLGDLLRMPDGSLAYRSPEALALIAEHNRQHLLAHERND